MRRFQRLRIGIGILATAAMLLLSSPGVRIVRAAGDETPLDAGPVCEAGAEPQADAEVQALVRELQRRQPGAPAGDHDIVVLNNRGYNYGPPPGIQLDRVRAEAGGPARH